MRFLDLTFPTPAENLACDEALVDWCEKEKADEILRFWEADRHFVVVGHGGKVAVETDLAACRSRNVPVLRRLSGGGTVLQGPGCLSYSLILDIEKRKFLNGVSATNRFVMERLKSALALLIDGRIEIRGFTDLVLKKRKFSGNSQYRKRRSLLFHGTFLLDFDIPLMDRLLPVPSKQPAYRENRSHGDFLTNLHLPPDKIKKALKQAWGAAEELKDIPLERIEELVRDRYASKEWTFKF
jgi:lipoate-protein ligase A